MKKAETEKWTIDEFRQHMLLLLNQAEEQGDEDRVLVIRSAYGQVLPVEEAYQFALHNLKQAVAAAFDFKVQRDIMLKQHDELLTAVVNKDRTHQIVRDLITEIEHELYSGVADQYEDFLRENNWYISSDPGDEIVNRAMIPVAEDVARDFHGWLVQESFISDELKANLAEYMTWFVHEARREREVVTQ